MQNGITSTSANVCVDDRTSFWLRFRQTFGPSLVGLIGGSLTVGIACIMMSQLLKNVSNTYAEYPSLQPPWLARDISLPRFIGLPLALLGILAPFGMGLATAWLVRSRDRWEEVSAGLTTALTASVAAYVVWIGWAVSLSTVVVPSISDLTLFGDSTRTPVDANLPPSEVLTKRYPDLKETPPNERGARFFAKVVSDQVVGSAYGIWMGAGFSLATIGLLGFCGTLAGGWLLRRGESWRSIIVPYFELTLSTSLAAGRLILALLGIMGSMSWIEAVCLLTITTLVVTGVIARWYWLLRVTTAVTWVLVLWGAGLDNSTPRPSALTAYFAYAVLGILLLRQLFLNRRPVVATA